MGWSICCAGKTPRANHRLVCAHAPPPLSVVTTSYPPGSPQPLAEPGKRERLDKGAQHTRMDGPTLFDARIDSISRICYIEFMTRQAIDEWSDSVGIVWFCVVSAKLPRKDPDRRAKTRKAGRYTRSPPPDPTWLIGKKKS